MPKHRLRESIKTFFGSHVDPEKDEELKGTKTGILLEDIEQGIRTLNKQLIMIQHYRGEKIPAFHLSLAYQKMCILQTIASYQSAISW